jgi:hypothetical protein
MATSEDINLAIDTHYQGSFGQRSNISPGTSKAHPAEGGPSLNRVLPPRDPFVRRRRAPIDRQVIGMPVANLRETCQSTRALYTRLRSWPRKSNDVEGMS